MRYIFIIGLLSIVFRFTCSGQSLYDINSITTIELTFESSNWDQIMDQYYSNVNGQRLLATCTVNGTMMDSVGVKYKGNSTYSPNNAKNPLNIKLNYTHGNQDYQGWYTLKLSNGDKDPTFVREPLSYEITRKYMEAPMCNYAKVYVNGNYYGLFSNSESVNKKFVSERFYSGPGNPLFKCNASTQAYGGSSLMYLGAVQSQYEASYEIQSGTGWPELMQLTSTMANSPGNVESELDIDRAIWMVAIDNMLVNLDSYISQMVQNYYLFYDDNNRFDCIKWDFNESIGRFGGGPPPNGGLNTYDLDPFLNFTDSGHPLLQLVNDNARYRRMYVAHCKTILEENFADNGYLQRAQSMLSTAQNAMETDPNAFYTYAQASQNLTTTVNVGGGPGGGNVVGITELMDARYAYLMALTDFTASAPTIDNISSSPQNVVPNSSVFITAQIGNADYAYLGHRENAAQIFSKIEMLDDGNHGDGNANDGNYGASVNVAASDIQYYIYAENSAAGKFSPARAEHEFHTLLVGGDVVINELMASNSTAQTDEDGQYDDWIELYNRSGNEKDLSGYYLSDNSNIPDKWQFPTGTTIGANGYLIVWADKDTLQAGLHANFRLSSAGESLLLSDGSTVVQDVTFGAQTTDMGYARVPNATGPFIIQQPTFNTNNDNAVGLTEEVADALRIYPDPADDQLFIQLPDGQHSGELMVFDMQGRLVSLLTLSEKSRFDISSWSSGLYLLRTDSGLGYKLIKQ